MRSETPKLVKTLQNALLGVDIDPAADTFLLWLAIALCRQRSRQDWLVTVARNRLDPDLDDDYKVPGIPEWSYDFHGRGLCLTGPNNEILDVDFYAGDDGPQTIDPHFFVTRVVSLTAKPAMESRLISWFGNGKELLVQGLEELRERGVLVHPTSNHVFHLHPWLESNYDQFAALDFDNSAVWEDWTRLLGDCEHESSLQKAPFYAWATSLLADPKRARIIEELAPLLPRELAISHCYQLLAGAVSNPTGRAIRALRALQAVPGDEALAFAQRLDPEEQNPFSAVQLAHWLFEYGMDEQALALVLTFARQRKIVGFRGNPFDSEYAVLALRYARDAAPDLVHQALRSRTPSSVTRMAALLSVLDEPWCHQALLVAASEAEDASNIRFFVGCLMHCSDENLHAVAAQLLPPPVDFEATTVGYTREEVLFLDLKKSVVRQRERAREVAALIRPH